VGKLVAIKEINTSKKSIKKNLKKVKNDHAR
jgi:hypothetical protein